MRRTARNTDARVVGLREQAFWPAISSRLGSTLARSGGAGKCAMRSRGWEYQDVRDVTDSIAALGRK